MIKGGVFSKTFNVRSKFYKRELLRWMDTCQEQLTREAGHRLTDGPHKGLLQFHCAHCDRTMTEAVTQIVRTMPKATVIDKKRVELRIAILILCPRCIREFKAKRRVYDYVEEQSKRKEAEKHGNKDQAKDEPSSGASKKDRKGSR